MTHADVNSRECYPFDDFVLDAANWVLYQNDVALQLQPKQMDVLIYLVRHSFRIVTKEELVREVWPGVIVESIAVARNISQLRSILGDSLPYRYIETVQGGYRFTGFTADRRIASKVQGKAARDLIIHSRGIPQRFTVLRRNKSWLLGALFTVMAIVGAGSFLVKRESRSSTIDVRQLTHGSLQYPVVTTSLSPNGNLIAWSDQYQLVIGDTRFVERHSVPLPHGAIAVSTAWASDVPRLVIQTLDSVTHVQSVWMANIIDGKLTRLAEGVSYASLSPDSESLAYVAGQRELWIRNLNDSTDRQLSSLPAGWSFSLRTMYSPDGRYLLASNSSSGFHDNCISAFDIVTGKRSELYCSTEVFRGYLLTSNYQLIVAKDQSFESRESVVLSMKVDLQRGTSTGETVIAQFAGKSVANLSANADGSKIILTAEGITSHGIEVADLSADGNVMSKAVRITHTRDKHSVSSWLDDHTVLYHSNRGQRVRIYKQDVGMHDAEVLVDDEYANMVPAISNDKRWLFYLRLPAQWSTHDATATIVRRSLIDGTTMSVDQLDDDALAVRCAMRASVCAIAEHTDSSSSYYVLDPQTGKKGREVATVPWEEGDTSRDWDISPDGRHLAFINVASSWHDIGVINLEAGQHDPKYIKLDVTLKLQTLMWDAAGAGFFVSSYDDSDAIQIVTQFHVGLDGQAATLRQQIGGVGGWMSPSPDGKHIAYHVPDVDRNIWMITRR